MEHVLDSSSEDDLQIIEQSGDFSEEEESDTDVVPAKRQKLDPKGKNKAGAAVYKSKFQAQWQKKYPFLTPVAHDTSKFHCGVCNKDNSCAHQGETDVVRHIKSTQHTKAVKAMKHTQKLSFLPRSEALLLKEKVILNYV